MWWSSLAPILYSPYYIHKLAMTSGLALAEGGAGVLSHALLHFCLLQENMPQVAAGPTMVREIWDRFVLNPQFFVFLRFLSHLSTQCGTRTYSSALLSFCISDAIPAVAASPYNTGWRAKAAGSRQEAVPTLSLNHQQNKNFSFFLPFGLFYPLSGCSHFLLQNQPW